ncbi:MAG: 1-acyl-sn-glycerol-3-phosphate acyltransferase [Planctomycetes bacterium]|nr:1-acyl-sn-glycerol-3-phosphate acyltransferase [Planctomycetota bacterium]
MTLPENNRDRQQEPLLDQFGKILLYPPIALLHHLRWVGTENIPDRGPAILASNHQSYYDPIFISMAVHRHITYMALQKFFHYPLIGPLMKLFNPSPVEESPRVPNAYRHLFRALERGEVCGIFPEGGRTEDGLPQSPRPGAGALAIRTNAPVIPVTVDGAYDVWPLHRLLPRAGRVQLYFGEPLRFGGDTSRSVSAEQRQSVAREIMLKIIDGFDFLGKHRIARLARRRLRNTASNDGKKKARKV